MPRGHSSVSPATPLQPPTAGTLPPGSSRGRVGGQHPHTTPEAAADAGDSACRSHAILCSAAQGHCSVGTKHRCQNKAAAAELGWEMPSCWEVTDSPGQRMDHGMPAPPLLQWCPAIWDRIRSHHTALGMLPWSPSLPEGQGRVAGDTMGMSSIVGTAAPSLL